MEVVGGYQRFVEKVQQGRQFIHFQVGDSKGKDYEVAYSKETKAWKCTCKAAVFGQPCGHIRVAEQHLREVGKVDG